MSQLLLRFQDEAFDNYEWTVVSDDSKDNTITWQQGNTSELPTLISQNPLPIILFIPQQLVYFTEFEIPERASRQVLASIEYQIEDQLAQDTELQHCALGTQSANSVPIFVVAKSVMETVQALQQKYGLKIQQVFPEMFLCPQPAEDEVTLISSDSGLVLRFGKYQSVKCRVEALPSILKLIARQLTINRIGCYAESNSIAELLEKNDFEVDVKTCKVSEITLDNAVNLQQRQFQATSHWVKLFQAWKSVAVAAVILIAVIVTNRAAELQAMEQRLSSLKTQQYELIKDYVGPTVTRNSNLKKEMIRLLQSSNSTEQQISFLHLLLEFSRARESFQSIKIEKIGYQQERLSIDISSQQLNDVESLHAALKGRGLNVDLDRLNIKPELVSGQFVVRGVSNG